MVSNFEFVAPKHIQHDRIAVSNAAFEAERLVDAAEKLAMRREFSAEHKGKHINDVLLPGLRNVAEQTEATVQELKQKLSALRSQAALASVTKDDVAVIDYARRAIEARLQAKQGTVIELWNDALERGDKTTLRAFYDFGVSWEVQYGTSRDYPDRAAEIVKRQLEATYEVLASEENRKAVEKIAQIEGTISVLGLLKNQIGRAASDRWHIRDNDRLERDQALVNVRF